MKIAKLLKPILAIVAVVLLWQAAQTLDAQQPVTQPVSMAKAGTAKSTVAEAPPIEPFLDLLRSRPAALEALRLIDNSPHPGNGIMLLELVNFIRDPGVLARVADSIERETGVELKRTPNDLFKAIWSKPYEPNPRYAEFKAKLYSRIDPRFAEYFENDRESTIRLDEVRWGGVVRDGIPPLKDPKTLAAEDAKFLGDNDVIFGVVVNGEARAYPKRILAWHEMVKDTVGGTPINGVYCTLCGSMIVYFPKDANGVHHELGTSGFLYRSNKVMYDHATKSMWSTIKGEPTNGPLVGKGIKLPVHNVVTTTWKQWKKTHPDTTVLSLDTGHRRDYGEGVAYRSYFGTDKLMFTVPGEDRRLKNKDQVFIVRHREEELPLAINADFLKQNPVYHDKIEDLNFVVVTDPSGANRAFKSEQEKFRFGSKPGQLVDEAGGKWNVTEEALVAASGNKQLARLPSHRAFWFGWHAVYPETRLIK